MSALDTLINNTNGLIVHLPLTDSSTASPPTMNGPSVGSLTSSWGAGAVPGSTAILGDDTASTSLPAASNAYAQIAANALLLPTGDMSAEIFIKMSTAPGGDTAVFGMSALNNWYLYTRANGAFGAQVQDATPTGFAMTDNITTLTNTVHLVVRRFGDRAELIINGALAVTKQDVTGQTRQTSQAVRVGTTTPGTMAMQVAHAAFYSRALTMGEIRARCDLATIQPSLTALPTERSGDISGKGLARGSLVYDAGSGTRMSINEQQVVDANGLRWEAASYAATKPDLATTPIVPTGTSTPANELAIHTSRLMLEGLEVWTKQRYSSDVNYFSSGQWVDTNSGNSQEWRNILGVPVAAALLHRYGGGNRNSWLYRLAADSFEYVINVKQDKVTGNIGSDTFWALLQLPTIYLALYPTLDIYTRNKWKAALAAGGEYEYTNNGTFYVNGNIEFARTHCWWYLWQVTGDSTWLTRMETQFANAKVQAGSSPQAGFGFVTTVAGAQADGSDSAGYFKEAGAGAPGLDWNYTGFQSAIAARLYSDTNDIRFLKIANMCWNTLEGLGQSGVSRINRRTTNFWTCDTTGGTRHSNAVDPMDTPYPAIMAYKAGNASMRNDAANMVRSCGYTLRTNYNGNGTVYRQHGDTLGEILRVTASDFPDLKLR